MSSNFNSRMNFQIYARDKKRIELSNAEWEKLMEIMEAPIKINRNLKQAIADFSALRALKDES